MQLKTKLNKGICFLLCVIDTFGKCTWVIRLKDKNGIAITNAFQKILNVSKRKLNKLWVDKDYKFYNRSAKSWLEKSTKKCIQHIRKKICCCWKIC